MTLLLGVLVASLLGSVHCAAMCGAFVCGYASARPGAAGAGGHATYHAGRLLSYVALGTAAGALGSGADRLGALAGVGRLAAVLAGSAMVLWAGATIAVSLGARLPVLGTIAGRVAPQAATRRLGALLLRARDASPTVRAGVLGLLTTLIPCGWLYAFVATAGATASPVRGAAVMAFFWAGTVPALLAVAASARWALGPLARRMPVVSAAAVLVLGLLTIAGRVQPLAPSAADAHAAQAH